MQYNGKYLLTTHTHTPACTLRCNQLGKGCEEAGAGACRVWRVRQHCWLGSEVAVNSASCNLGIFAENYFITVATGQRGRGGGRGWCEAWQLGCPSACFVATCNLQRAQCGLIKYDKYETRASVSTAERMPRLPPLPTTAHLTTPLLQSELIKLQWQRRINF